MPTREQVLEVFGSRMPEGATSFVAASGVTTFCVGRTGQLVTIPWAEGDEEKLRALDALGTLGLFIEDGLDQSYTIPRTGDRKAVIEGRLLNSANTKKHSGPGETRWWKMALYRLRDGRYAVHVAYHSQWRGESNHDALILSDNTDKLVERLDEYQWTDRVLGFPRGHEDKQANLLRVLGDAWDQAVSELLDSIPPEQA